MKLQSITKTGTHVSIEGSPSSCTATVSTPMGIFNGYWGKLKGNDGVVCTGTIKGNQTMICITIPKTDWDKYIAGIKSELNKNVPGLEALRDARNTESLYHDQFEAMMNDESNDGLIYPKIPVVKSSVVAKEYPIAAAYLKAESWENAAHYVKATVGASARKKIADGLDYIAAIEAMEKEWAEYCTSNID